MESTVSFHYTREELHDIMVGSNEDAVDWEHPSDSRQGANYVALLSALRQCLPAPRYTLSSALPAGEWALQHINLAHASQYLDMINLM